MISPLFRLAIAGSLIGACVGAYLVVIPRPDAATGEQRGAAETVWEQRTMTTGSLYSGFLIRPIQ
jgi:hypothetical protein